MKGKRCGHLEESPIEADNHLPVILNIMVSSYLHYELKLRLPSSGRSIICPLWRFDLHIVRHRAGAQSA